MTSNMHSALRAEPADRDLLILAAKAAGLTFNHGYDQNSGFLYFPPKPPGQTFAPFGRFWNPLTDDGDAFRLAVKLGMACEFTKGFQTAQAYGHSFVGRLDGLSDPMAAARRVVVMAAAEAARRA